MMMVFLKKISIDQWVIIGLLIFTIWNVFNLSHWKLENKVISEDVVSYYGYLPATFIYGDATLQNPNEKYYQYEHAFLLQPTKDGRHTFKTTMGMAVLYSPFFFLSHVYVKATGGLDSGFSAPYQFAIVISSVFYFLIGLIFLRKVLLHFYSKKITATVLLLVVAGTNYFFYVGMVPGYVHNYVFCLLSVLIFLLIKWYANPSNSAAIGLGAIFGFLVLIRPTLVLLLPFLLLFGVKNRGFLKTRLLLLRSNSRKIMLAIFCAFVVWIPQLIYWKAATGSYLFYSYTEERFYWNDPKIIEVLFSFRNGWLLYTPIMIFSIIGIVQMIVKKTGYGWAIASTLILFLYVNSCWWVWWFGGSYGYRTMIDLYPILALALGFFLQQLFTSKRLLKISGGILVLLLLLYNIFQTRQAHEGLIHHDSMTAEAYGKIFLKLTPYITVEDVRPYLDHPDYAAALKGDRDL